MTETFRPKKSLKYMGVAFTAIFLVVVIAYSSIFFLKEPAKHGFHSEQSVAIVGGMGVALFGMMLLLSLCIWISYYVERFAVDGTTISVRSLFHDRQFDAMAIHCLKWRIRPSGGTIVFRSTSFKAKLALSSYGEKDRLRIIRVLHDLVPSHVQEGWPEFCYRTALPLRDGKSVYECREPSAKSVKVTRKRYDRMFMFCLPLSIALGLAVWVWFNLAQFIALPVLVIAAWLLLRFCVPPQGRDEVVLTSTSSGRVYVLAWVAMGSAMVLRCGLGLAGVERCVASSIACVVAAAGFLPMLYMSYKLDKRWRIADQQGAESAPARWQQGEDAAQEVGSRSPG